MKMRSLCLALPLALIFSAGGGRSDPGPVPLGHTASELERDAIRAGLTTIGVGPGCEIVVADNRDLVEDTAARELQRFLARASLTARIVPESEATSGKRILLGRESNLRVLRDLGDKGGIRLREVSPEDDGYQVKRTGGDLVIAGANPRGVLYGVYALEDFVGDGAPGPVDMGRVPHFRK